MDFIRPTSWADALTAKAEHPDAVPIAGGTDLMDGLNFGHRPPPGLLDLTAIDVLGEWHRENGSMHIGAGVTYSRIIEELPADCPGLAIASRTVARRRSGTGPRRRQPGHRLSGRRSPSAAAGHRGGGRGGIGPGLPAHRHQRLLSRREAETRSSRTS
jgi:hypothetical protein